jgi:WD40 repeat protein
MSERADLHRVLGTWLRAEAPRKAPDDLLGPVFDVTSASRPLPTWRALLSVPPMRAHSAVLVGSPTLRLTRVVVVALVIGLLAVMGALLVGSRDTTPPAGSGLIVYESGGDIYVGDPATGDTRAIVASPEVESGPIFSPDGTRIAFLRGDVRTPVHSLIVVRADGSDERVVMPAGFSTSGVAYAWTPDGRALVVNHDSLPQRYAHGDGELSVFDATGYAEPRLLTPPLSRWPGAFHPQIGAEIAPMLKPPLGDRILSYPGPEDPDEGTARLVEMDLDGSNVTGLIEKDRMDVPFDVLRDARWSPDAAAIAFTAGSPECPLWACIDWDENWRAFVMNADASRIRRLTREPDIEPGDGMVEQVIGWSPDGSMVLVERQSVDDVATLPRRPFVAVTWSFAAVNVTTGMEHEIGTPYTITTRYAPYPRSFSDNPIPEASWSPDGLAVMIWEGPGSRPIVIDAETGASRTLPWASDSSPSWR